MIYTSLNVRTYGPDFYTASFIHFYVCFSSRDVHGAVAQEDSEYLTADSNFR